MLESAEGALGELRPPAKGAVEQSEFTRALYSVHGFLVLDVLERGVQLLKCSHGKTLYKHFKTSGTTNDTNQRTQLKLALSFCKDLWNCFRDDHK